MFRKHNNETHTVLIIIFLSNDKQLLEMNTGDTQITDFNSLKWHSQRAKTKNKNNKTDDYALDERNVKKTRKKNFISGRKCKINTKRQQTKWMNRKKNKNLIHTKVSFIIIEDVDRKLNRIWK